MADIIIEDLSPRAQVNGNGVQTVFNYQFPIFSAADLKVYVDDTLKTLDVDYTVSGVLVAAGGSITFTTAPADLTVVTIIRDLPIERTSDFQQTGDFNATTINTDLDKLIAMVQQLEAALARVMALATTDTNPGMTLPVSTDRANKIMAFDANGAPVASTKTLTAIEDEAAAATAAAATSAGEAAASAVLAASEAVASAASAAAALASQVAAALSEANAATSAIASAASAASGFLKGLVNATGVISPNLSTDDGSLYVCDTSGGAVTVTLPEIGTSEGVRYGFYNKSGSNAVTLNRSGTDTINGGTTLSLNIDTEFLIIIADDNSPDNWITLAGSSIIAGEGILKVGETLSVDRGFVGQVPQNSQSADYTCVLADAGKHILHPSADTTARTFTIPANASVAYPVGAALTFVNQNGAGVVTLAITSDTLRWAGEGTTGSRTLAANAMVTALKIGPTEWMISGSGMT